MTENPIVPSVEIVLDKPRKLILDMNIFAEAEKKIGSINIFADGLSAITMRALVWANLKQDDPDITIEQVGAMMSLSKITEITAKLGELYVLSMPEEEDPPPKEVKLKKKDTKKSTG